MIVAHHPRATRILGLGELPRRLALGVIVFALALLARAPHLDLFATQDEDNWIERAAAFHGALAQGDWRGSYRSGHPGVTTMWLATIGMGDYAPQIAQRPERMVTRAPQFMNALEAARHAMIVANAALMAATAVLAARLLGWGPGLLAGGLLAFDPFLVAHGQVVHLDAPVAGFLAVALMAGAIRWFGSEPGSWPLALSAVAGGLAFLTKSPSAFLVLAIPIVAALGLRPWRGRGLLAQWLRDVLIWGALAGSVALLLWPALATNPVDTFGRLVRFSLQQGGQPHAPGNYFLGQPVPDPGPLFYPLALALRGTPVACLGLACLVLIPWWERRDDRYATRVWVLIGLAVAFVAFMSLGAKKLDRYIVPAFPFLDVLAGLGLWLAGSSVATRARVLALIPLAVLLAQPLQWWASQPYPLAYYNPLMGGGPTAERLILVGWGEGLDQAAAYLNAQPDAAQSTVAVYYPLTVNFQAVLRGTAVNQGREDTSTFVVDYVNARQRRQTPRQVIGVVPDYVVRINGIDYARIYRRA